jgi:bifunctional DNA-binding transcriptional regulator/antitoxin component of YhaV-PrlF toxin-antitoxin module
MPKLSSKNQITVPVSVLEEVGLSPGDNVIVRPAGPGRLEIEGVHDFIKAFAGSMPPGTWPPGEIDALRDEWER